MTTKRSMAWWGGVVIAFLAAVSGWVASSLPPFAPLLPAWLLALVVLSAVLAGFRIGLLTTAVAVASLSSGTLLDSSVAFEVGPPLVFAGLSGLVLWSVTQLRSRGLSSEAPAAAGTADRSESDEQLQMVAFGREIGLILAQHSRLEPMLQQCAEAMVQHLDGAFARIWTLNSAEDVLELQASAGMYTHLDGAHSRIRVGEYKIGEIAQLKRPHLTNEVVGDNRVHDQTWAAREKMVAFAGYPLVVDDRLIGVMAMFARHPLSENALEAMASVATALAVGVERKHAEEKQAQQQEWLQTTLTSIGDAVITADNQQLVTFLNPVASRLTGWSVEEARGRPLNEVFRIVNEQTREPTRNPVEEVLRTGQVVGLANHTVLLARDGTECPIDDSAAPIRSEAGKILGAVLVFRDVSERRQGDLRLRDEHRVVETLHRIGTRVAGELELQPLLQLVTDETTGICEAQFGAFFYNVENERGEAYLLYTLSGVSREQFAKFPMPRNTEVFAPTFRGDGTVRRDDITQDPRFGKNEPYYGMPEGHLPVKSYLAVPVISRSGQVLGGLFFGHSEVGVFTERHERIVEGVAAHAAVAIDNARLYQRVQESEQRFRQFAENMDDVFWMSDPTKGEVMYVSPAYQRIWQREPGELLADPTEFLRSIHPDDRSRVEEVNEQQTRGEQTTIEYRILLPDGQTRWIWDRGFPLRDAEGKVYRVAGIASDITDRKNAQDEQQKLSLLVENSPDFIGVARLDEQVLFLNAAGRRLVGLEDQDVTATRISEYFPDDEQQRVREHIMPLLLRDRHWDGEVVFRHFRTGERIPVAWNVFVIPDPRTGEPAFLACVSRDLREQKRSEQLRKTIMDNATAALFMMDVEGRCTFMNPAAEDMTGYTFAELQGALLHDKIHHRYPDGRPYPMSECPIDRALPEGSKVQKHEDVFLRKDGSYFPVLCSASPIVDGGGPMGTVVEVRDVTDEKRNEALLLEQKNVLERIVQGAPLDSVLEALCQLVEDHSRHRSIASILLVDEDQQSLCPVAGKRIPGPWGQALARVPIADGVGACGTAAFRGEAVIASDIATDVRWKDYRDLALQVGLRACWSTPIFSSGNQVLGTFAIYYDEPHGPSIQDVRVVDVVTRTAGIAIERKKAEDALRESDRRKDEFLATLAHELRNPLAPIRNGLEILRLAADDAQLQAEARTMMERQVDQMVRLVDDLLDVSRISRGKIELKKSRVLLDDVVRNAVETSRPFLEEARHDFTMQLPDQPVWLEADPTRLSQVLSNLLNNAARYTQPEGKVRLDARTVDGHVVIRVEDNGVGIPAEVRDEIFEMFTQVDNSGGRGQGGLGIGLTLVQRLVEMHDGSVEVASEGPGRGSQFSVHLPMASAETDDSRAQEKPAVHAGNGPAFPILVADDNPDALTSLALLLRMMGPEVDTVDNGAAALEQVQRRPYRLVFLDIGMPEMDGYEVMEKIRQLPEPPAATFIALTGWGQAEDRQRSKDAGFDMHLVKPVDVQKLQELVNHPRHLLAPQGPEAD